MENHIVLGDYDRHIKRMESVKETPYEKECRVLKYIEIHESILNGIDNLECVLEREYSRITYKVNPWPSIIEQLNQIKNRL